jgi:hypothetical protein
MNTEIIDTPPTPIFEFEKDTATAVICAIAKEEQLYIEEWIEYHIHLGFAHIYIYDNDSITSMRYLVTKYPSFVTVLPFPGKCQQLNAYHDFLHQFRNKHHWVAYIDVDEFIVLKKHNTIIELLKTYCHQGALALNWVLFGSNHHQHYQPQPVLERFTRRQIGVNQHIKWIARTDDIENMVSPHHGKLRYGIAVDCHGNQIDGPFNTNGTDDIACIHHYFTKSKEEFMKKCERGRADIHETRNFEHDFSGHDSNDIEDMSAWNFFIEKGGLGGLG